MGSVYKRGPFWWVVFKVPDGGRVARSTGISSTAPEREARLVLQQIERELSGETRRAVHSKMTVAEFAVQWTAKRKDENLMMAARDFKRLAKHAFPSLGAKRLGTVTPSDVRAFVSSLKAKKLAPRSVRNVYGLLRRLFNDAVAEELIISSPCALKKRDLPKKADKDPMWRARAVFTRDEVDTLLSNAIVPLDRRLAYAFGFCGGMRQGEIAALRWNALDDAEPLPRILVGYSYSRHNKVEKSTKTGQPREVPMHVVVQRLLVEWRDVGFEAQFGRAARPDDLVLPNRNGAYRTESTFIDGLYADLAELGFRKRRFHDTRRTFISLARSDGANSDVLRTITHDAKGDQFDEYTTFSFETKCEAVMRLNITGRAVSAARAASGGNGPATRIATREENSVTTTRNASGKRLDRAGLEPSQNHIAAPQPAVFRTGSGSQRSRGGHLRAVARSNVANQAIVSELHETMLEFARGGDRKALAARLRLLLAKVRT